MGPINPSQIVLQLGIAGLIVWVGYKLALRFIDSWRESERERTAQVSEGFKSITTSVNTIALSHGEVKNAVVRLEGKIDATLDWQDRTPVEGVPKQRIREGTYYTRPATKPGDPKKG